MLTGLGLGLGHLGRLGHLGQYDITDSYGIETSGLNVPSVSISELPGNVQTALYNTDLANLNALPVLSPSLESDISNIISSGVIPYSGQTIMVGNSGSIWLMVGVAVVGIIILAEMVKRKRR